MNKIVRTIVHGLGLLGVGLLLLNLYGLTIPLRSPEINENYADFARPNTLAFTTAWERLQNLAQTKNQVKLIEEGTRIFHNGMAHIDPKEIKKNGLSYYRMRVPAWENFILYALSFIKPDTYMDYEFCSYRKALERGTGRCGQQALALVGYLHELGVNTGFVRLGGHAMATAKVNDQWFMMDPDFGGVIPFSLSEAEKNPASVRPYYWSPAAEERELYLLFDAEENGVKMGGPTARWGRACAIEKVSYAVKWLMPPLLAIGWLLWFRRLGRQTS